MWLGLAWFPKETGQKQGPGTRGWLKPGQEMWLRAFHSKTDCLGWQLSRAALLLCSYPLTRPQVNTSQSI